MSKKSLDQLRSKIENIDTALLRLLNERAVVSSQIGRLKVENGLNIYDHHREESIFRSLAEQNQGPLKDSEVNRIFYEIISVSRKLQSDMAGGDSEARVRSYTGVLSGNTSVYGILGNPVAHSMSPRMHNAAFRFLGIDAIYLPFAVEDLQGALSGMKALGIKGASVTHPFKTEIFGLIDEIDDTAEKIGAVNTLVFGEEGIRGTNTDWIGAVRCLEAMLPIAGHRFVVMGTGGAARAVVYGVVSKGGEAIVVGRSEEKGHALAKEFDCTFVPLSEVESAHGDCLVNTTPVGMYPEEHEMPVPTHILGTYKAVADVIYNPFKTKLLREAEAAGCM
ncbi:MAG: shikimate dehydrogenase, partial [Deltaproteobacteria bacterium]|nr:shikimate dehydrogenase [Deltaproteobacteria bacterium]